MPKLLQVTNQQVMEEITSDSQLNEVRKLFSGECSKIEQAAMQHIPLSLVQYRRMEFDAVIRIAKKLGVDLSYKTPA